MKRYTRAEKLALRKASSILGSASMAKLTAKQRKARARAAGIASGKARKKKAGKNV